MNQKITYCWRSAGAILVVVALFVVRKDPSLTERAIIDFCRQSLAAYKTPRHVYFRDELPKTNVGKILRKALREEVSGGQGAR